MSILQDQLFHFLIVIGFMLIYFFSKYLELAKLNTRKMMSFAAGVGISYVIIHMLPLLEYSQKQLAKYFDWQSGIHSTHLVYGMVLIGLIMTYVVFKIDQDSYEETAKENPVEAKAIVFWSDIYFFAVYNAMIGYLVMAKAFSGNIHMITYFIAFGLHFLMNDCGLRHHHNEKYDSIGRKVLAISILFGGVVSLFLSLPYYVVVAFEAFITGGLLLNGIKFELPNDNNGDLKSFVLGAVGSGILFLFV